MHSENFSTKDLGLTFDVGNRTNITENIYFYLNFQISSEKYKIQMNPVDVLNLLGNHGFRVNGFTAEADQKMVWTLEQKDFENKINNSGSQQHRHN